MSALIRIDRIGRSQMANNGMYLVASSFEPRSVRATSLVSEAAFRHAILFSYEDTLDTVMGRHHSAQIKKCLQEKLIESVNVLPCNFSDPFSVVRVFDMLMHQKKSLGDVASVTIDATCFTKVHLLLLLQYLQNRLHIDEVRICYTEPLSYATAFGRQLSYGIDRTVYLPYQPIEHRSNRVGLIAFLGHERLRLERIVQELEPDFSVVILGDPGYARHMQDYSLLVNRTLIYRTNYDYQYRLAKAPANDLMTSAEILKEQAERLQSDGCDTLYLAALGTKIQALGFDLLRRSELRIRMLLAYSIPKRYERNLYSQGIGPTYIVESFGNLAQDKSKDS